MTESRMVVATGYDKSKRSFVADASGGGTVVPVPREVGSLRIDEDARSSATGDFGGVVSRTPGAVSAPESVAQLVALIAFANDHSIPVAVRGSAHSLFGHSQVDAGISLQLTHFATVTDVEPGSARIGGGARWRALVDQVAPLGLVPPVLTDYLDATVGGTLSMAGFGGASARYGAQVEHVLELEVVTGAGEHRTCSMDRDRDLFEATLSGLGQCALIVSARVALRSCGKMARHYTLPYPDLRTMLGDMSAAAKEERFAWALGLVVPTGPSSTMPILEVAEFYDAPNAPDDAAVLAGMRCIPGAAQIRDVTAIEFYRRFDEMLPMIRGTGTWEGAHPWFDAFVPASKAADFIEEVLAAEASVPAWPPLFNFFPTKKLTRPLLKLPDDEVACLFDVFHCAPPGDDAAARALVESNQRYYEALLRIGGTMYAMTAIPKDDAVWRAHYGASWESFAERKRRFDPRGVLGNGAGVFATK